MTSLHTLAANTPGLPCRNDPDLFFSTHPTERQYAASLCRGCPIQLECVSFALDGDERYGVWGGTDVESRVIGCGTVRGFRVHRRRGEEPCPLCQAAQDEAVETDRRQRLAAEHALGGTVRGYWLHWRLGEDACRPCKTAQARKSAARRAREREASERAAAVWETPRAADRLRGAPAGAQPLPVAV